MGRSMWNPRWRMTVTVALLSGLLAATAGRVAAAPGDLDPSFGTGGKVWTVFGGPAGANAIVLQPDGQIIVAGQGVDGNGNGDFVLARYHANGALDPSFGSGSMALTDFGGDAWATAMALQPDGRIVTAGVGFDAKGKAGFALARYQGDGAP